MSEAAFLQQSQAVLEALESALETVLQAGGWEFDLDRQGPVLTLEWADGACIVINSHASAQEIWVAARSGGFHCRWQQGQWVDTRTGQELFRLVSDLLSAHTGVAIVIPQA